MAQSLAVRSADAQPGTREGPAALDSRRKLQLALAVTWLLDAMLQFQPAMFGQGFPQMLAGSAQGNPAAVARPITWSAAFIGHHVVMLNAIFAVIQLLLGLGLAFRPTVKLTLAASVAWALGVWWLGEGLGGLLAGTASPFNGAPGAVALYALLAILLWPADRDPAAPFPAARAVGRRIARATWLAIWLGLAILAHGAPARSRGPVSRPGPGGSAGRGFVIARRPSCDGPGQPVSGPAVRGPLQDRDGHHHGLHADPDALDRSSTGHPAT